MSFESRVSKKTGTLKGRIPAGKELCVHGKCDGSGPWSLSDRNIIRQLIPVVPGSKNDLGAMFKKSQFKIENLVYLSWNYDMIILYCTLSQFPSKLIISLLVYKG